MLKCTVCVGIPASGKSTWAREELKRDPSTVRVNRDELRIMMTNYVYSEENEKLVISTRNHIISSALKTGRNVIIDDTNINRRNFDDIVKLVNGLGVQCMVMEKPFFIELDEAISRNTKREGHACVPEEVIRKMWKQSGGTQHKFYKPRVEMCGVNMTKNEIDTSAYASSPTLPWAIMCDLDGTISLFNPTRKNGTVEVRHVGAHVRNPYDASTADEDTPNEAVVEVLEIMAKNGYHIIFCSGRDECYRGKTEAFLKKHTSFSYDLIMRKTGDNRKDSIIKEELFNEHIAGKFNILMVLDDRSSVVAFWRSKGLTCWQVNPGDF
jgi:predicted kinase